MSVYNTTPSEENPRDHAAETYERAVTEMQNACDEDQFLDAAELFDSLGDYRDAKNLRAGCLEAATQIVADMERRDRMAGIFRRILTIVILVAAVAVTGFFVYRSSSWYIFSPDWVDGGMVVTTLNREGETNVEIPYTIFGRNVIRIGNEAFKGCYTLQSVTIPGSVGSIGDRAFDGCFGLTNIVYDGTSTEWNRIEKGEDWDRGVGSYVIHCNDTDIRP